MSRRSAVATDTGTVCATFARAEASLGSLPPQPNSHKLNKMTIPVKAYASLAGSRPRFASDSRESRICSSRAASGLPQTVVIRKPLSAGKYDEFSIVVIALSSVPKGLDVQIPAQVAEYCLRRPTETAANYYRPQSILSPNKRSPCDLYKHLPSLTRSLRARIITGNTYPGPESLGLARARFLAYIVPTLPAVSQMAESKPKPAVTI